MLMCHITGPRQDSHADWQVDTPVALSCQADIDPANIVNGYRKSQKDQTTLIVAPSTLVNQWEQEFRLHAQDGACGTIQQYHSGSKLSGDPANVADTLSHIGVVITTYDFVRSSYPKWQPDPSLTTAEAKAAWWHKQ